MLSLVCPDWIVYHGSVVEGPGVIGRDCLDLGLTFGSELWVKNWDDLFIET